MLTGWADAAPSALPLLALGSQNPAERPWKQTYQGGKYVGPVESWLLFSPSGSASCLFSLLFKVSRMGEQASFCLRTASGTECRLSAERMLFLSQGPLGAVDGASRFSTRIYFLISAGRYPTHRLCFHPRMRPILPWAPT